MKNKIAVIFGGRSLESDISVLTALEVLAVLSEGDYDIMPFYLCDGDFYTDGVGKLEAFTPFSKEKHRRTVLLNGGFYELKKDRLKRVFRPDAALVCCHGGEGENGVLQGLLEFNGIASTCSGVGACAVTMDKAMAKSMFEHMLFNVIQHKVVFTADFLRDPEGETLRAETGLRYPLIVKPASQGSSIGIRVAENAVELREALEVAAEFDCKMLVEEKLCDFFEVNCAAFSKGDKIVVSATERPKGAGDILTFEDKYMSGGKSGGDMHIIPADIGELNEVVREDTERIYRELGLRGIVRVDYLVDRARGKVYVNEVNTVPGSLAFYLFEPVGIGFYELVAAQIEEALSRRGEDNRARVFRTPVLEYYAGSFGGVKGSKRRQPRK